MSATMSTAVIPARPRYPFTEAELQAAHEAWGANCGPGALAFALQIPIAKVRGAIPEFDTKRYTSPSMMKAALKHFGCSLVGARPVLARHAGPIDLALARIQWTGPWTAPGVPAPVAYRFTHWIATWMDGRELYVFDVNGGMRPLASWEEAVVPALTALYPKADGGWKPTHVWVPMGGISR
jgi:hypothetical protein